MTERFKAPKSPYDFDSAQSPVKLIPKPIAISGHGSDYPDLRHLRLPGCVDGLHSPGF